MECVLGELVCYGGGGVVKTYVIRRRRRRSLNWEKDSFKTDSGGEQGLYQTFSWRDRGRCEVEEQVRIDVRGFEVWKAENV